MCSEVDMLKLTYTENNFTLERLDESLEDWVNVRVALAVRLATGIHVEPSTASFLLTTGVSCLLKMEENSLQEASVKIHSCDTDFVEVVLKGLWLTSDVESEGGVFVTALSPSVELLLQQLSQLSVTNYQSSVRS
ncbi:alr0857 family protein [Scytonema sp. NUACC26]|uniref:alr0857 family protein n=1 Tax=Scytonema sp. NUACC26 TaxID=3140176 RepID=UPI0038B38EB5